MLLLNYKRRSELHFEKQRVPPSHLHSCCSVYVDKHQRIRCVTNLQQNNFISPKARSLGNRGGAEPT